MASQNSRRGAGKGSKGQVVRASPTTPAARAAGQPAASKGAGQPAGKAGGASSVPAAGTASRRPAADGGRTASAGTASARAASARTASARTAATRSETAGRAAAASAAAPVAAAAPATGPRRVLQAIWAPVAGAGVTRPVIWLLSLFGLGVSIYLTIAHFDTKLTLACPDTGLVNCLKVTTSPQSEVFGVLPVAVLGLAFYVFLAVVNSPWFWAWTDRLRPDLRRWAGRIRLGSVAVGMCFVLYLIYAELIVIKNICLWCTSVHVATFLIFALLVFYTAFAGVGDDDGARLKA
jgi:uncharacterized membrane protein